jgi:hypothetical protein
LKWIGQHIVDLIARFRGAVYLEDVSTGTIASGGNLGLDSNNKIVKANEATGDITSVVAGTGLSGGGTAGDVTLNIEAAQSTITSLGTLTGLTLGGNKPVTPGDGAMIHVDGNDITDGETSASGTAAKYTHINIEAPRLNAQNPSVTTTEAATLYINNAATVGAGQTITNNYALWVDDGLVKFDGALTVDGTITGDVTGDLTGRADSVSTITTLAPDTATTQATQPNITTCESLVTIGTIGTGVWNGTKITDIYTNSSGRRYGSTIKILPSDFIVNDEGTEGAWFDEDANSGMVVGDTNSEMWTFVAIPEGMTATAVNIYSNNTSRNFYVYEMDVNVNGTGSSLGNDSLNTAVIIDVDSTATNFLAIKLDLNNITQRIWGGIVTIAPQ